MSRISVAVKLAAILVAYAGTCFGIASALVGAMHFKNARGVLGAQYSLGVFLLPNALSFALSAWIMRSRWSALRIPHLISAGFFLALATILLMSCFVVAFSPFFEISVVSTLGARIAMVAPGIIAAQALRLGTNRSTSETAA
jgi:hypothetical protein